MWKLLLGFVVWVVLGILYCHCMLLGRRFRISLQTLLVAMTSAALIWGALAILSGR